MIHKFEGHFDEVACMAVRGTTLYTGSLDCTIRKWSIAGIHELSYPLVTEDIFFNHILIIYFNINF